MADDTAAPRSRRALLTGAAAAAAALAASAALPLTASAADPDDVVKNTDNATTDTTSVSNSTADKTALAGNATGTGFGVAGSSTTSAGVVGWSMSAPPAEAATYTGDTGVYGWAPEGDHVDFYGSGVWGDSPDVGVYGTGSVGILGYAGIGVEGDAFGTGGIGVYAFGDATQTALYVDGKAKFKRSGRATIGAGKSNVKVTLAGVNSGCRVFALLHSNRTGRWVQSVVPVTGSFTIYLNGTVSAATYVAWFVLN